jgi:hypothetical protein
MAFENRDIIEVVIDEHHAPLEAMVVVRSITGASFAEIRKAVESKMPIMRRQLYMNDFVQVAKDLRSLVDGLERLDVPLLILEDEKVISSELLRNLLDHSKDYR